MTDRRRRNPRRPRGVPEKLVELRERGLRIRYNGFWLNESPRDRRVAEFIDHYPGDLAELIKDFLHRKSVGEDEGNADVIAALERIIDMLEKGNFVRQEGSVVVEDKEINALQAALDAFRT